MTDRSHAQALFFAALKSAVVMERLLTPDEAEQVVEQRIEEFGLSSLPRVHVAPIASGEWQITWDTFRHVERPMTATEWREWLERHVGTLNPEQLETLEG
jgi:hypothetical protein